MEFRIEVIRSSAVAARFDSKEMPVDDDLGNGRVVEFGTSHFRVFFGAEIAGNHLELIEDMFGTIPQHKVTLEVFLRRLDDLQGFLNVDFMQYRTLNCFYEILDFSAVVLQHF